MASFNFTNLSAHLAKGSINFDADTFKAMLVTTVPDQVDTTGNQDTWIYRTDVNNEHAASGGYVAGGFVCTPAAPAVLNLANEKISVTFANGAPAFTNSTITAVGAIIYKSTGVAADDLLICFVDFGGSVTSTAGDFNVTFSTPLEINV